MTDPFLYAIINITKTKGLIIMEDKEEWEDIVGYEGLYQVSNLGRVKRLPYYQIMPGNNTRVDFTERILKQGKIVHKNRPDYKRMSVTLSKNSKLHSQSVARLVALHFVPNPDNKPEVHHLNDDPTDNRAVNLQWVTRKEQFTKEWSENQSNAAIGREAHNKLKVKVDGVLFASYLSAALFIGCNKNAIASAKYRHQATVKGHAIEFVD